MDKVTYIVKYDTYSGVPYENEYTTYNEALRQYGKLNVPSAVPYKSLSRENKDGTLLLRSESIAAEEPV